MPDVLIDTSFLVALNSKQDKYHSASVEYAFSARAEFLIPDIALTEVAYLIKRDVGEQGVTALIERLVRTDALLQPLLLVDLERAREIMIAYPKAKFDFVDSCIMALAERLNIRQICTFDRRDFSIFKPIHCDYLELLP